MSRQPRNRAAIARVRITTAEVMKRQVTVTPSPEPLAPPVESREVDGDETPDESAHPSFYPFPLRRPGRSGR